MTRLMLLPAFATAWVLACSSNSQESTTSSDTGTPSCELHDGGCDPGCCPQEGTRYDSTRDCLTGGSTVIGCTPKPATTGCGVLGVVGCAITPAGTFFTSGRAAGWNPPTPCPETFSSKVISAKACTP